MIMTHLPTEKTKKRIVPKRMAASAVEIQVIVAVKISWSHFMDLEIVRRRFPG